MKKFEIKNQEEFNECLMWISDLYKDVHGFRPRCYNFEEFSFEELSSFVNDLSEMSENQRKEQEIHEDKCVKEFRKKFETIMEEQNQGYHKALEWMFDGYLSEEGFDWFSVESFGYYHGIIHTELGRKIQKDLFEIVENNRGKYNDNDHQEIVDQEEILDKEFDPLFA